MAGLNSDPTADASYASLDFAWYSAAGDAQIYENGQGITSFGPHSDGTKFQVHYDGQFVRYYMDGSLRRGPIDVGRGKTYYFDSSLEWPGSRITNVDFASAGEIGAKGADGINPPVITASATPSAARYNAANQIVSGDVTFTAMPVNAIGPVSWTSERGHQLYGMAGVSFDGNTMTISAGRIADVLFYNEANFGAASETIIASVSGVSFRVTVTKVRDGEKGTDGVSPIAVTLQPSAVTFQAYANGSPYPAQFPYNIGVTATQAGTAVPVSAIEIVSTNGLSVAVDPLRITGISSNDGYAVLDISAAGQKSRVQLSASIVREGSDGSVATRLAINAPQLTWTDFNQHGTSIAINASASGKLTVNLTGQMTGSPSADYVLRFVSKDQYRSAGGSWIDVPGSQATSTEGGISYVGDGPGSGTRIVRANVNGAGPYALTGLTAEAPYEVRVLTYRISAAGSSAVGLSLYAERTA